MGCVCLLSTVQLLKSEIENHYAHFLTYNVFASICFYHRNYYDKKIGCQ